MVSLCSWRQGIAKKAEGGYEGRAVDAMLHRNISELLDKGTTWKRIVEITGASRPPILRVESRLIVRRRLSPARLHRASVYYLCSTGGCMNPAHVHVQLTWWASVWPVLQPYLPLLALIVAVIIPLSASFFGAWTAQRIAERNRFRDEIIKEIRSTNAAISLAMSVCNTAMSMKRQQVTEVKRDFDQAKASFAEHMHKRKIGQIQGNTTYRFLLPLKTLPPPKFAIDSMRSVVLDRISVLGRPLHLAVELAELAARLVGAMEARNEDIEAIKKNGGIDSEEAARRLFGLPFGDGQHDLTFEQTLTAIVIITDNMIFFAYLLCKDLQRHGHWLTEKYRKRVGGSLPHIVDIDFSERIADGTIPPAEEYADWTTKFVERKPAPTRWQRIRRLIASKRLGK